MFIQIIQGICHDADALRRQTDTWREEVAPKATGWLGGTYGVTDDHRFIGVVRFESSQAAARNSATPEQDAWWSVTKKAFDGEVSFHDCDEVTTLLDGGSDQAGFVQVIQGRVSDPRRHSAFASQPMDRLRQARPEVIGGTLAMDPSGFLTQTMAFTSEDAARRGESQEMPEDLRASFDEEMSQIKDLTYLDLRHPWFSSRT
ncbi:MAG: hypothetical protein ABI662_12215 [Dermatophilaceae bacterium]